MKVRDSIFRKCQTLPVKAVCAKLWSSIFYSTSRKWIPLISRNETTFNLIREIASWYLFWDLQLVNRPGYKVCLSPKWLVSNWLFQLPSCVFHLEGRRACLCFARRLETVSLTFRRDIRDNVIRDKLLYSSCARRLFQMTLFYCPSMNVFVINSSKMKLLGEWKYCTSGV